MPGMAAVVVAVPGVDLWLVTAADPGLWFSVGDEV